MIDKEQLLENLKKIGFIENPPGGYPSGTIVEKVNSEKGDANTNGTIGTIMLGVSLGGEFIGEIPRDVTHMYAVDWGNGIPVAVNSRKLKKIENE